MDYSSSLFISAFVFLFLFFVSSSAVQSVNNLNYTKHLNFGPGEDESRNNKLMMKNIRAHLKKINKPAVKTIQSPDGDLIDCVPSHLQPAFDHPLLKGQDPMVYLNMSEPESPILGHTLDDDDDSFKEDFQVWRMSGESCPENTVPIRRTTEKDILRAESIRESKLRKFKKDYIGEGHEHAIGKVKGNFSGTSAILNVWLPKVVNDNDFSFSQIWILSGSFDAGDLNTIEVGWMVGHDDAYPRLFIFWTRDAYKSTGCFNMLCGFVLNSKTNTVLGAGIKPFSTYAGNQFDISILVMRNTNDGNWWLYVQNIAVGYWPASLFTGLLENADEVQFGGEVIDSGSSGGSHTSTEMGSGHFPVEGYRNASYVRNIQVFGTDYTTGGTGHISDVWGCYMYYGGPGKNDKCP